jgi:hypothetical protein
MEVRMDCPVLDHISCPSEWPVREGERRGVTGIIMLPWACSDNQLVCFAEPRGGSMFRGVDKAHVIQEARAFNDPNVESSK